MAVISARKTSVVTLELEQASDFVRDNHRAGMSTSGKRPQCFGLMYEDDLVAVAIFCNPRTSGKQRQYTTELLRLAFKSDTRVQGGASKLIKHFMKLPTSVDLFTYQDTSGEATDVYQLSGMTPVGPARPTKTIVVKDGLTAESATNNRSDWFSMEQVVKRGPDALIGTTLGEVIEDSKRVTNLELFLRNGYHTEVVPGDRVYEWHNPAFQFYTYKITSTVDDGYYYGRHGTRLTSPEEMLNDGYMGSGGVKYKNWVKSVGTTTLRKEVVGIYRTRVESVKAEESLIGDSNLTDPRCKNSKSGGTGLTSYIPDYTIGICPIHGETKFRGGCKKCSVLKAQSMKNCPEHGDTLHVGDSCYKCVSDKSWSEKECSVHGLSLHQGRTCQKCNYASAVSLKECSKHGSCLHNGNSCITCTAEKSISVKECPIHGETKHVGDNCKKCMGAKTITVQECSIHGITNFKGDNCCKCSTAKTWTTQTCPVHGESKHRSGVCEACTQKERVESQKLQETLEDCSVHGKTAHSKGKCKRCAAQSRVSLQECIVHGVTKFTGDTCGKCALKKIWTVEECSVHGETKHRSGKCERCSRLAQWAARKARKS